VKDCDRWLCETRDQGDAGPQDGAQTTLGPEPTLLGMPPRFAYARHADLLVTSPLYNEILGSQLKDAA
jgi:hypothetical protein